MSEHHGALTHQPGEPQNRTIAAYVIGSGIGVLIVVLGTYLGYLGILDRSLAEAESAPFAQEWTASRSQQEASLEKGQWADDGKTVVRLPVDLAVEKVLRSAR